VGGKAGGFEMQEAGLQRMIYLGMFGFFISGKRLKQEGRNMVQKIIHRWFVYALILIMPVAIAACGWGEGDVTCTPPPQIHSSFTLRRSMNRLLKILPCFTT
jgi:hypothetical protein